MTQVANDFEGGTSGNALSTDSSGDAFDSFVTTGTGTEAIFSNTNEQHGALAAKFLTNDAGSGGQSCGVWSSASLGTLSGTHYGRLYGRFTSLPGAYRRFFLLADPGGWGDVFNLLIDSAGTLRATDTGGVVLWTSSVGLLSAVDWRIEYALDQSQAGSSDTLSITVFTGANKDGTTPDASSGTLTTNFGTNTVEARVGWSTTNFDAPREVHIDDVVVGATSAVGPVGGGGGSPAPTLRIVRSNLRLT
jgi:hypothetical protein